MLAYDFKAVNVVVESHIDSEERVAGIMAIFGFEGLPVHTDVPVRSVVEFPEPSSGIEIHDLLVDGWHVFYPHIVRLVDDQEFTDSGIDIWCRCIPGVAIRYGVQMPYAIQFP